MDITQEELNTKPYKLMKYMAANFDASCYMCPGIVHEANLVEQYAFVILKGDLLSEKRAMIPVGHDVSILLKYKNGDTDIIYSKFNK